jgi:hypothetical protein
MNLEIVLITYCLSRDNNYNIYINEIRNYKDNLLFFIGTHFLLVIYRTQISNLLNFVVYAMKI